MATTHVQMYPFHQIEAPRTHAPSVRTLVVDDTPAMSVALSAILSEHPWINIIGTERNGLSAVRTALTQRPDLIVMDLNMPVMNGLKATMHIKQHLPETRVLIMSSDDDPEIALAAMDCGADGFIPKASFTKKRDWHIRRLFGEQAHAEKSSRKEPLVYRLLTTDGIPQ